MRFLLFLASFNTLCIDFLQRICANFYGSDVSHHLMQSYRISTVRQYETSCKSLIEFIKHKELSFLTVWFLFKYFIWVFEVKKLQANTISSYNSALIKSPKLGFDELHSVLRREGHILFDAVLSYVKMFSNPECLVKNETFSVIRSFKLESRAHHKLCPMMTLIKVLY